MLINSFCLLNCTMWLTLLLCLLLCASLGGCMAECTGALILGLQFWVWPLVLLLMSYMRPPTTHLTSLCLSLIIYKMGWFLTPEVVVSNKGFNICIAFRTALSILRGFYFGKRLFFCCFLNTFTFQTFCDLGVFWFPEHINILRGIKAF